MSCHTVIFLQFSCVLVTMFLRSGLCDFLLTLGLLLSVNSLYVWSPSTSLDDSHNWAMEPSPCDRLKVLQTDLTLEMSKKRNFAVSSLMLSKTGVLLFPEGSFVSFSSEVSCPPDKVKDNALQLASTNGWLDPLNWKILDTENESPGAWRPHRDYVPGTGSQILFANFGVDVILPSVLVPYRSISIANKSGRNNMDGEAWMKYLKSEEGYENFKGPADLREMQWRFQSGNCAGGSCGPGAGAYVIRDMSYIDVDSRELYEAICKYALPRCEKKESLQCFNPIFPEGHCCGVCGSIVEIESTPSSATMTEHLLLESELVSVIASAISTSSDEGIPYYIGWTSTNAIQVVLIAKEGDFFQTLEISREITSFISKKPNWSPRVMVRHSGLSKQQSIGGNITAIVLGTFLFITSFFGTIILYVLKGKRSIGELSTGSGFTFARFKNARDHGGSNETLQFDPEQLNPDAFVNPLFAASPAPAITEDTHTNIDDEDKTTVEIVVAQSSRIPPEESEITSNLPDEMEQPLQEISDEPIPVENIGLESFSQLESKIDETESSDDDFRQY